MGCRNKTTIAAAMKAVTSALATGEAATITAVVDTFVRAIETGDFERRLQLVEADCSNDPGASAGMNGAGPGWAFNP